MGCSDRLKSKSRTRAVRQILRVAAGVSVSRRNRQAPTTQVRAGPSAPRHVIAVIAWASETSSHNSTAAGLGLGPLVALGGAQTLG